MRNKPASLFLKSTPEFTAEVSTSPFAYQWVVEFVDVSAKHSVAKFMPDKRLVTWEFRIPDGESVVWSSEFPWTLSERLERQIKALEEWRDRNPRLGAEAYGGAIIDLTRPGAVSPLRK